MAALETSKLFIIPFINHQNQPLDRNFASFSTLRNEVSCISIQERDLKPIFHNLLENLKPKKTTLLICTTSHPSTVAPRDFRRTHFTL
jgi:hypothetical protein